MRSVTNVVVAASVAAFLSVLGLVLYKLAGLSKAEAGLTVVALILGAAQIVSMVERRKAAPDLGPMEDRISDLAQDLAVLRKDHDRLTTEHRELEAEHDRMRESKTDQTASQMVMLETLVKQIAEGVDSSKRAPVGNGDPLRVVTDDEPEEPPIDAELLARVRQSLDENRIDLYLQPIVTLPQRKTRFYEGLSRLRGSNGEIIMPSDYLAVAERSGMMPVIDNLLLFRCVQVVRRMVSRNREIGVFCNISPHSLLDPEFFPQFLEFMSHNTDLKESLYFEFGQEIVSAFGALELESLRALREMGFVFSLDRITNLDIDPDALDTLGFRFVKVDCDMMLGNDRATGAQIHPADLSELLGRRGIELIVEKVEAEKSIVDLLDYKVAYAQGYLFSEPRPVRSEILAKAGPSPMKTAPLPRTGTDG